MMSQVYTIQEQEDNIQTKIKNMYQIKNIIELESLDFSNLDQEKSTVRKSLDGQKFIISGDDLIGYTNSEILVIVNGSEWSSIFKL